jgi:hypothetical protein
VLANFPFSILGSLCTAWTLYGMAGLRPDWQHVLKAGTLSSLLYLTALQVSLNMQAAACCWWLRERRQLVAAVIEAQ